MMNQIEKFIKIKNIIKRQSVMIAFFTIISSPLISHTLIMKDGDIIVGKIKNQNKTEVVIDVDGVLKTYPKTLIKQIEFIDRKPVKKKIVPKVEPKKETSPKPPAELNMTGIMWRSAVVPGWGHYKIGEKYSAAGYLTLSIASLGYSYSQRQQAKEKEKAYQSQTLVNFALVQSVAPAGDAVTPLIQNFILGIGPYNQYQDQVTKYNQSFYVFAIIYTGHLVHAWLKGKKFLAARDQNKTSMNFNEKNTGWNLAILPTIDELNSGKSGFHGHFSFYQRF